MKFNAVIAAMVLGSTGLAQATTVYGNLAPPGVYFGSGNVNGNWWVDTTGNVELGLRAKNRATGAVLDGADGSYNASTGLFGGNKAMWNYEFSVNPADVAGLTYRLGVDHDPSVGMNYSYVTLPYWVDNATNGTAFQNSQNVKFGDTPGGAFDVTVEGLYGFTLQAWRGNALFSEVSMQVQVGDAIPVGVLPEPGSLALLLPGIAGVMWVRRRKGAADAGLTVV